MLTVKQVQEALPVNFRANVSQDMVNQLNTLSTDPDEARIIRDNVISFAKVLQHGQFKISDYVRASMYVSYKLMGHSNLEAYKKTFPDRYARMVQANKPGNAISSIVSAYNKGELVSKITERSIVPAWVLNQDVFQDAINTQSNIMKDPSVPARDRVAAANSIIMALKKPDAVKTELEVTVKNDGGMAALEERLNELTKLQRESIINGVSGMSAKEVAEMAIMANMKDVTP